MELDPQLIFRRRGCSKNGDRLRHRPRTLQASKLDYCGRLVDRGRWTLNRIRSAEAGGRGITRLIPGLSLLSGCLKDVFLRNERTLELFGELSLCPFRNMALELPIGATEGHNPPDEWLRADLTVLRVVSSVS